MFIYLFNFADLHNYQDYHDYYLFTNKTEFCWPS